MEQCGVVNFGRICPCWAVSALLSFLLYVYLKLHCLQVVIWYSHHLCVMHMLQQEVYVRRWLCEPYMLIVLDQLFTGALVQRYVSDSLQYVDFGCK